jgi:hypothetical protein
LEKLGIFIVFHSAIIPLFSCFTIRLAFGKQASTTVDKFYQSCNFRKNKEIPPALPQFSEEIMGTDNEFSGDCG